ncbi:MAG: DUF2059 domain-containing protein [Bacteroidota bacterium]
MRAHVRCFLLIIILLSSLTSLSVAQDGSTHLAAAVEFLSTLNMQQVLSQTLDGSLRYQLQTNPELEPYQDVMRSFLTKHMSWESLKDSLATIYAEEFTEDEIRALIGFYKTALGRKTLETFPALFAKGSELGENAVKAHLPELTEAIQKRSLELSKQ